MPDPKKDDNKQKNAEKDNETNQTGQANVKFRDIDFEPGNHGDNKKNKNKNKGDGK